MYKPLIFCLLIGQAIQAQYGNQSTYRARLNPTSTSMKLINGQWFNGSSFEPKTVWTKDGILYMEKIETTIDTVIDLAGQFVIPPFGEAHNHNLESSYGIDERIASYLRNGVFYVKHLSSIKKRIAPLMSRYNHPTGIDVSLAHAPLTASGGHPIALRKSYLDKGYFKGLFNSLEELEFHGYVIIDNEDDLKRKWDSILSFRPDFIKLNLLYSEAYEERKNDTSYFGKKGLDPKLIPAIVQRAHAAGLRVSAHVESAYDFHVAVNAGVDEIAHLPELKTGRPIAFTDALLAQKKGIVVVTTVSLITKRQDLPEYSTLLRNCIENLKLLKRAGVILALGSDMYNDNATGEFRLLRQLNVFSTLELLKMWTENAAYTTFPNRKIGRLKDGYEASFLVLKSNPITNIDGINENIDLRVKQGVVLN